MEVQETTEAQDMAVQEVTEAQDMAVQEVTEAQDTVVPEMTEAPDTVVKEVEALDLVEVQKIVDAQKQPQWLAVIVEKKLKYHSNQNMIDLFIAENVSKITNLKNVVVALDSTEDQVMVEMTEVQDTIEIQEVEALDLIVVQKIIDA